MRFWEFVRHALVGAWRARLRSALTALGIAIATGALVSMVGFVLGLQAQIDAPLEKLGLLNNIEVRLPAEGATESLALDDAMLARLEQIPGVEYAYPDVRLSVIRVAHGETRVNGHAIGLPREAALISLFGEVLVAGTFFSLDTGPEAIVGEQLVADLGFDDPHRALGATLDLEAAGLSATDEGQFTFEREQLKVRIVGVFRPPSFATEMGADALLLPVDTMRDLPGSRVERGLHRLRAGADGHWNSYSTVIVRAQHPRRVADVEARIRALGFTTRAVVDQIKEIRDFLLFMQFLLAAVGTVALVVAGLGILNTLLMTVMERYQEIGLYKAMGASDGDVRVLFLTEAAVVGAVGGLAGLALAGIVSALLQWAFELFARWQEMHGPTVVFRFPWWLLASAVAYAVLVSVLSGWYPASRAAQVDPIRALKRE